VCLSQYSEDAMYGVATQKVRAGIRELLVMEHMAPPLKESVGSCG